MKKVFIFSFLVVCFSFAGWSQTAYNMSNGTITTCSGSFQSSQGFVTGMPGSPGYNNNESFVMTFCPGTTPGIISMDFVTFVLGTGDVLTVYNGSSTAAPILGVYDVTNPLIGNISAISSTNPGGCLTFSFVSDTADFSNGWFANVSCDIPCQLFEVEWDTTVTDTSFGGYVDVCLNDTIALGVQGVFTNNNVNYLQTNANTQFYWYEDSVLIDSGAVHYFAADSAGAQRLYVNAVDVNGCTSINLMAFWVRVASPPDFSPSYFGADTMCFGDTNYFVFGANSVSWSNADSTSNAPTTFLPDGSGSSPGVYDNTLTFTKFGIGDTISAASQITRFYADMEHSFLGDLSITMTCPNGSSTILKNFPGGGGRWLGEACDGNLTATPGIGYVYEWFPAGNTLANMVAHSGACVGCPVVNNPCGFGTGTALQSSSYNTFSTMNNMIGCPLNGTWTLTIVDQWAIDNGFLFTWGVEFDSALYPSTVINFDPGIDSIGLITPNNVTTTYAGTDSVVFVPTADSATYCYTVEVLDGFGCTYDSTFCFFVRDMCDPVCYTPAQPTWVVKKVSCLGGSDGALKASPDPTQMPFPWTYIWTDNSGTVLQTTLGIITPDSISGLSAGTYHLEIIDANGCSSNWIKGVGTINPMATNVVGISQTSCATATCDAGAMALVFGGTSPYSYFWSSGDTVQNATMLCAGANWVQFTDANGCLDTVTFNVTTPAPIQVTASQDTLICYGTSATVSATVLGGTPPYSYTWSNGLGTMQTANPSPIIDNQYYVLVTDANNCAPDSDFVNVLVRPPLQIHFNNPDTVCPGDTSTLSAWATGGDSTYNYAWSNGLGNTASVPVTVSTSQFYTLTVTDNCGTTAAVDSIWLQVGGYPQLEVVTTPDDTVCIGEPFYLTAMASGGDGNYSYVWDNGLGAGQSHAIGTTQTTMYTVTVTDECLTPAGVGTVILTVGNFEDFNVLVDTTVNCDPGEFNFTFDTINTAFTYEINYGKGFKTVSPLVPLNETFTADGCVDVRVRLTSQFGCETVKLYPCLVEVLPRPIANFDFKAHSPDYIENYVDFWDKSIGVTQLNWFWGDSLLSQNEKFTHSFPEYGTYNIKLVVNNDVGCFDSTHTNLVVRQVTTYFFPTAFTPDGNGVNEEFKIVGDGVQEKDYHLAIFDRWGGKVFETTSLHAGWNGKMMNTGDELPVGQYSYTVTLRHHDGRKVTETGEVTLIR